MEGFVMLVGEVCNRDVIITEPSDSIYAVAELMRSYHVGDVVVVERRGEQRVPVGIMTDRDIVIELIAKQVDMKSVTVGDAMSTDLLTAQESDQLTELVERMRARGVRRVPVVNGDGGLVGIVAVDDVVGLAAEQLTSLVMLMQKEGRREEAKRA
jgi:CBS domain-containing protein